MTAKELKEHILTQLTADEALERLLEGALIKYSKLKFNEGEAIHPIILMSMCAIDLGWGFLIEKSEEDIQVRGIITGTEEYLHEWTKKPKE